MLSGDVDNPILHVEELMRWPLHRPRAVPGAVHVYLSDADVFSQPQGGLTLGELWLRGMSRLYVVDVNRHQSEISCDVTSRLTGLTVAVEVSCAWQVVDAIMVVDSGLVDIRALLRPLIDHVLDSVLADVPWESARGLALALNSGLLPERVETYGVEVSGLRAVVVAVSESELAPGEGEDG